MLQTAFGAIVPSGAAVPTPHISYGKPCLDSEDCRISRDVDQPRRDFYYPTTILYLPILNLALRDASVLF